ncbi:acetate--CoA ligase family protein [Candidatus Sumerlaeota bacterium]|nr:acetate--CoA ligase family protein [Candidatus Sumerlaeota bacterium]
MRLYEFEAKKIFREMGIPTPQGILVASPAAAGEAAKTIGGPVVVKAQVLTGGRGKAGGIKKATDPAEAEAIAADILGMEIRGFRVDRVLIEPVLDIAQEIYLGVTIDRLHYRIALIASASGGVDIEEVAATDPDRIKTLTLGVDESLYAHQGVDLAKRIGLTGKAIGAFANIAKILHSIFYVHEAKLVEINPLALTSDGKLIAADGRMSVDEDALFRHGDLVALGVEGRHEEGEMTERERRATQLQIPYVDLEGDIGMFPGGAGFGIAGNDLIIDLGGQPANFMDSGGGPTPERLAQMLGLLQENPRVKVIFGARFGGVSRCDDFAKGVIQFLETGALTKPFIFRMTGNMVEEGMRLLSEERERRPELFANVQFFGIETPIEHVAKRAVEAAAEIA